MIVMHAFFVGNNVVGEDNGIGTKKRFDRLEVTNVLALGGVEEDEIEGEIGENGVETIVRMKLAGRLAPERCWFLVIGDEDFGGVAEDLGDTVTETGLGEMFFGETETPLMGLNSVEMAAGLLKGVGDENSGVTA